MMASKLLRVVPTCHKGGFGPWFELDWTDHPNHSMTARHVVLAERKLTTYVYAVGCYRVGIRAGFLPSSFTVCLSAPQSLICHIEVRLQVLLASRCLAGDARLWCLTQGGLTIQGGSWADFRALSIVRYGPLPDEEANMPYRDPDIYNDMYMRRYLNYVAEWQAYPNESMGHYCWRDGLSPKVKQFIPVPIVVISLEHMIDAIMEA
ncbi:hypothetical protein TIFTF001_039394 [Ficus carica]|uniref:Uncharacterized protein n=1 Tax=Ficus carica TaxID=3494 RepID=A0AA88EES9_FICCA|nr:hypothetical protein TIFTF001_039394 [Ficus carica]